MNWDRIFAEAHLHFGPGSDGICIQNVNPNPHAEGSRNIFLEDREEILAAAAKHGYRQLNPEKINGKRTKNVSFWRPEFKYHLG